MFSLNWKSYNRKHCRIKLLSIQLASPHSSFKSSLACGTATIKFPTCSLKMQMQMVFSSAHKNTVNGVRFTASSLVAIKMKQKNVHLWSGHLFGGLIWSRFLTFPRLEFLPVPLMFWQNANNYLQNRCVISSHCCCSVQLQKKDLAHGRISKFEKRTWLQR